MNPEKPLAFLLMIIVGFGCGQPDTKEQSVKDTLKDSAVNDKPNETNVIKTDTLVIGDLHIAITEQHNFLQKFRSDPHKFYYKDPMQVDFFLLHDDTSKDYLMFGVDYGGCIGCIGYMEFIDSAAFRIASLPEEIQDTVKYKPHPTAGLKYDIVQYPFLKPGSDFSAVQKQLIATGFRRIANEGGSKVYRKTTDLSITNAYVEKGKVVRITILLNIDVD
jgi:hypothetical protein